MKRISHQNLLTAANAVVRNVLIMFQVIESTLEKQELYTNNGIPQKKIRTIPFTVASNKIT